LGQSAGASASAARYAAMASSSLPSALARWPRSRSAVACPPPPPRRAAVSPSSSSDASSVAVSDPGQATTGCSVAGSMTKSIGSTRTPRRETSAAFSSRSVSIDSHAKRDPNRRSAGSGNT